MCQNCRVDLGLTKLTEETKQKLSEKRKEYLKNNPDKHPWRLKSKFKSEPCENFKSILRQNNYKFLEEFAPSSEKNYSIDIAFPEKMIGVEINGNQHYESSGKLKPYYQFRHDHIESLGWKLYEIHYSLCFDQNYVLNLISQIFNSENKIEFNYEEFVKKKMEISAAKKEKYDLCGCGERKSKTSKRCAKCQQLRRRVVKRPDKDQLHYMIWNDSTRRIAKQFNVSDHTISTWCKRFSIKKPGLGYWRRIVRGYITDYQI